MLVFVLGIPISAHVEPGPAVKASLLNVGDVIGNQIVTQRIAFIHGAPQISGLGLNSNSHGIPDAGCVDAEACAVGVVLQNVGAMQFARIVIHIIMIGI